MQIPYRLTLLQDFLLLILTLAIENEKLIAPIKLDVVGKATWSPVGLVGSTEAHSGSALINLAHRLSVCLMIVLVIFKFKFQF